MAKTQLLALCVACRYRPPQWVSVLSEDGHGWTASVEVEVRRTGSDAQGSRLRFQSSATHARKKDAEKDAAAAALAYLCEQPPSPDPSAAVTAAVPTVRAPSGLPHAANFDMAKTQLLELCAARAYPPPRWYAMPTEATPSGSGWAARVEIAAGDPASPAQQRMVFASAATHSRKRDAEKDAAGVALAHLRTHSAADSAVPARWMLAIARRSPPPPYADTATAATDAAVAAHPGSGPEGAEAAEAAEGAEIDGSLRSLL